jgi:hypothetical protein
MIYCESGIYSRQEEMYFFRAKIGLIEILSMELCVVDRTPSMEYYISPRGLIIYVYQMLIYQELPSDKGRSILSNHLQQT